MRVLVACEFSGIVRDAFKEKGHDAWSCDILASESKGNHIKGDVLERLDEGWDLMIAHPPCTHLAVSGARWFKYKQKEQIEAIDFVKKLLDAPINKIALENPVSIISSKIRKPDQIIQPYMFGDKASKSTCFWLKNLPLLKPTNIVEKGEFKEWIDKKTGKLKRQAMWDYEALKKAKTLAERRTLRSKTFIGIAKAIAEQWH